ncbi:Protein CBG22496 [Caenorhabditis briggsae]|nr:Protein CBG22496 [Caenorhabditis briggsae]CCG58574.1 Protein CBG22496 [Caenorhabditis briggsae]
MQCVLEEHLLLGESRILQTKPTVDSILDACVEYQKSEGADDLEIIKWMRRQQDKPLVAEFAYWYMIAYDQENGREDVG